MAMQHLKRNPKNPSAGFTLIELMIVISIVAMLASMAVPSYQDRVIRAQVTEGLALAEFAKAGVAAQHQKSRSFPTDNASAGLPPADQIVGNFVSSVAVRAGALTITFGNFANRQLVGKTLSLRPAFVQAFPQVPIAWVCGMAGVPAKMIVQGKNETSLPGTSLPLDCRPGPDAAGPAK
jgi:type IV pilus assembly protein PilA